MVEILNFLKRVQAGIKGLQNMVLFHHTRHEDGNSDEISVGGLSGELADQQKPKAHAPTHQKDGADEISVGGLSGELADVQKSKISKVTIDADKDWAGKNITNFGPEGYNVERQLVHGIIFNLGTATTETKLAQALIPGSFTISKVIAYADTAPTGASIKINIKINGTSVWDDADRLIISAGSHSGSNSDLDHTTLAEGNRLSIDIDQVGSTTPGGDDLLVAVIC